MQVDKGVESNDTFIRLLSVTDWRSGQKEYSRFEYMGELEDNP